MTENTPTATTRCDWPECPGVAQDRHEIESGPELHDLCLRAATLTTDRQRLREEGAESVRTVDAVIRAVLAELGRGPDTDPVVRVREVVAERDALAAALELIRAIEEADRVDHTGHFHEECSGASSWKSRVGRDLGAVLSSAPATVLAQRDRSQRVEGVALASAHLKEHDLTRPGDAIHALHRLADQLCEADRIEREAQR